VVDPSTNTFANGVIAATNSGIAAAAVQQRAGLADTFTPFNLAQPQPETLNTLTLYRTALHDIHASDAGYTVIAQQFWAASGYARLDN